MVGLSYPRPCLLWKVGLHLNAARSCVCMWKDKCRPPRACANRDRALSISMPVWKSFLPATRNTELRIPTCMSQSSAPTQGKTYLSFEQCVFLDLCGKELQGPSQAPCLRAEYRFPTSQEFPLPTGILDPPKSLVCDVCGPQSTKLGGVKSARALSCF